MNKKLLIIGPAWVGDMVMAQTLFRYLKEQQHCDIDVIAPSWSKPLLSRMPEVNNSIVLPIGHKQLKLRTRLKIANQLRKQAYDQAILCPNSFKSAIIPFWAGIPKRTGWLGEFRYGLLNDYRKLDKNRYPLMIERFMALALPQGQALNNHQHIMPNLQVNEKDVKQAITDFALSQEKPILALCPGAEFGPAKRWPEEHYAVIANEKLQEGWQVWLFGSIKDKQVSKAINNATANRCIDLTGNTSLAQAIDLLSVTDAVVSNDSGLMHIAAALNKPLVVIYGSSSPEFTPPLNKQKQIVRLGLECSPCFKRVCPLEHLNCLRQLKPKKVLAAMDELAL